MECPWGLRRDSSTSTRTARAVTQAEDSTHDHRSTERRARVPRNGGGEAGARGAFGVVARRQKRRSAMRVEAAPPSPACCGTAEAKAERDASWVCAAGLRGRSQPAKTRCGHRVHRPARARRIPRHDRGCDPAGGAAPHCSLLTPTALLAGKFYRECAFAGLTLMALPKELGRLGC
jgi:hypothetical protein